MRRKSLAHALGAALAICASMGAAAGQTPAAEPLVLTRTDLERGGYISLADVLQRLPYFGGTINTLYNSGGDGAHLLDLRDLGPTRTLILVNGRRWIRTAQGTVDLTAIPLGAVERVELSLHGDAAGAPSGAIAGVVNIVLRETLAGAEASALLGENEHGDGRSEHHQFTLGSTGERGSATLHAGYAKQEAILSGDRAISAVPLFGFDANNVATGASSTTPYGRFGRPGVPGTVTLIPGRPGTSASDFRPFDLARDGYNFAPDQFLQTPQERTSLFGSARYDLSDTLTFASSVLYNERRSAQQVAAFPLLTGVLAAGNAAFVIPADNVFNPFGTAVNRAQFRNTFQPRRFEQDADTFRLDLGLDGAWEFGERAWQWNLGYTYTDSEVAETSLGQFDLTRLRAGLGPSFRDSAGVARCGTPADVIADCVPINIFGGPDGFTREMLDYATFVAQDARYVEQRSYTAGLSGELFELPAGLLTLAVGYEHRREFGYDQPDALAASGTTTAVVQPPARGVFSVDEMQAAFNVPLLRDQPFAHALDLTAGVRTIDHENGRRNEPHLDLRWRPLESVMVHAAYRETSRMPSIEDLFLGQADTFPPILDVCSASARAPAEVVQRCRDGFGGVSPVPVGFQSGGPQIAVVTSGNPTLDPETGTTKTIGVSWKPALATDLEFALNWHRSVVREEIGFRSGQLLLEDCYFRADVDACARVRRSPFGDLEGIFTGNFNLPGGTEVEGYELGVRYGFGTALGRFDIDWQTSYASFIGASSAPTLGAFAAPTTQEGGLNRVGTYGDRGMAHHRIRSLVAAQWQQGDWSGALTARYRSGLDESCSVARILGRPELCSDPGAIDPQFPSFGGGVNHIGSVWYVDLEGAWDTPWQGRITVGLRNAFDQDPPVSYSTFANSFDPGYEVPGRFWFVGYRQRF